LQGIGGEDKLARPQKEGLDYFPHDVYAASDPKLEPILLLYGARGYAFYFLHLEYIYRSNDLEFDISDSETREVIAQKLQISAEEYNQILESTLKKNLFDKKHFDETQKLTSNGIKKRASSVLEKRDRMRLAYEQKISAAKTTHIKKSKVKKSKDKVKDIYISAQHLSMTKDEYDKLVSKYGQEAVDGKIEYARNYKKLKNYVSLYLTLNNWLKPDSNKSDSNNPFA
jgi:hypothetical protein